MRKASFGACRIALTLGAALTVLLIPASAQATAPTPVSKRIVLGRSIGGVAIGQKLSKAKAAWGPGGACIKPASGPPGEPVSRWCDWLLGANGDRGLASFIFQGTVVSVTISLGYDDTGKLYPSSLTALRTDAKIRLGSSAGAVRRAYPRAGRFTTGTPGADTDYVIRGTRTRTKTTITVAGRSKKVIRIDISYL